MIKNIVIGASYGGMEALKILLTALPKHFSIPITIVLHIGNNDISSFLNNLNSITHFKVKEAEEKEIIIPGTIYFAPPNYHLQFETDSMFSLSTDEKVNYSRPSIDVLFETAAWAVKNELLGILLTGSNKDGAYGMETIKNNGGVTIIQNPESAAAKYMPENAIKRCQPDYILNLQDITTKIVELTSS